LSTYLINTFGYLSFGAAKSSSNKYSQIAKYRVSSAVVEINGRHQCLFYVGELQCRATTTTKEKKEKKSLPVAGLSGVVCKSNYMIDASATTRAVLSGEDDRT